MAAAMLKVGQSNRQRSARTAASRRLTQWVALMLVAPGQPSFVEAAPRRHDVPEQVGFNLAFVDADATHVVDAVFGEMLHANYTVDPKVSGTITLRTARPVGREQLVSLLEDALAPIGAVVVRSADSYKVVPRDAARAGGNSDPSVGPDTARSSGGFSSELVSLKYANPAEIAKLLQDFVGKDVVAGVNPASSQILVAGSSNERATALSVIRRFDVDTLSGAAFQLFRLQNADATELDDELRRVFRPPFDLGGRIRLIALPRLKSILVVAQSREDINRVSPWISRLDEGGATTKRRLFSYVVQNGRARDLAASLQLVLGRGGGVFAGDTAQPQPFGSPGPGSGAGLGGSGLDAGFAGSPLLSSSTVGSSSLGRMEPAQAIGAETPLPGSSTANGLPPVASDINAGTTGPRIVPVDANNSLLIYANGDEYDFIHQALEQMDKPVLQVMIEATLAEVTLTNDLQYGVNWQAMTGNSTFTLSNTSSAAPAASFPGFSYGYIGKSVQVVLNNLQSKTNVRVLSAPKLMVLNNQTATLQVGDEVPIVTQQSQSVASAGAPVINSVELRDTGVILKVTPRVNDSGTVVLDIAQEVSDVVPTSTSGINSPTIQQRRLTSTIQTRSGQMVALGGLIRENVSRTRQGIAGLSQIPVVGALFGQHVHSAERTELIILLTPVVLRSPDEAKGQADELLQRMSSLPPLVLDNKVSVRAPSR